MYFWCVLWGRWTPCPLTLPSWSPPPTSLFPLFLEEETVLLLILPSGWGVMFQSMCYPSHREVNNLDKTHQKFSRDFSNWDLWETALFPHRPWSFKDKILRQLIDMVSASWGELVSKNEKREAELQYRETETDRDLRPSFPWMNTTGPTLLPLLP